MATNLKKNESTATETTTEMLIPSFSRYYLEADPMDANSKPSFVPFKLGIEKTGGGFFKIHHRDIERGFFHCLKGMEVIFLYESPFKMCECSLKDKSNKQQVKVCESNDRVYSNKGYSCAKGSCPYELKKETHTRPMKGTVYFLARNPETGQFELVRYISSMDNTGIIDKNKGFSGTKTKARTILSSSNDVPSPSMYICKLFPIIVMDNNNQVGRFDVNRVEIVSKLSDADIEKISALIKQVQDYDKAVNKRKSDYNSRQFELRQQGRLDPVAAPRSTATPTAPDTSRPTQATAQAAAPATALSPEQIAALAANENDDSDTDSDDVF